MELWALLLLLGVAGLVYLLVQDYLERKRCKIPGPKPLPLLGNTVIHNFIHFILLDKIEF